MFLSPPPPPPSSPLPPRHPLLLPSVEYAYEFAYVACASACVASENQALMTRDCYWYTLQSMI